MATTTKPNDLYNEKVSLVVRDMIWKDHVSKIEKSQRVYDKKWGFLHDPSEISSDNNHRRSTALFHPFTTGQTSMMIDREHNNKHETDIQIKPSPRPIPLTSNRLIGWRTADRSCTLEKYGKYARGQESLHKKFKWPIEGFD